MANGLVLMTALVPTVGHQYLLDFATAFLENTPELGSLSVIISCRSSEPTDFRSRQTALSSGMASNGTLVSIYEHDISDMSDSPRPGCEAEFWAYWRETIRRVTGRATYDYVFASESYGHPVADLVGASFMPVDIAREVCPARGTDVRRDLFGNQHLILPEFVREWSQEVVFFGPESCGKTTMARAIARYFQGKYVHEWARPYLETVGPDITEAKLLGIVRGQRAAEQAARSRDTLVSVFDTDAFSTLGFYEYNGLTVPEELRERLMVTAKRDRLYIVMNDRIPFVADPLRYGGDRRETTVEFWVQILERHGLRYHLVATETQENQLFEIYNVIVNECPLSKPKKYRDIQEFQRR